MTELQKVIYDEAISTISFDYLVDEMFIGYNHYKLVVNIVYKIGGFIQNNEFYLSDMHDTNKYLKDKNIDLDKLYPHGIILNTFKTNGIKSNVYKIYDNKAIYENITFISKDNEDSCFFTNEFNILLLDNNSINYRYELDYTLFNFSLIDGNEA